jgi:monoamine oxidase
MKKTTRRDFIRLSSLATAGILTHSAKGIVSMAAARSLYDVVIIGGGLAGLTTAYELEKAGVSNILILEAKDRVGGRTLNIAVEGGYVAEGGGQWIGPTQTAITDLMTALGISSFPSYTVGEDLNLDPLNPTQQADYDSVVEQLDEMASTIPLDSPWSASSAAEWDNITLANWMDDAFGTIAAYLEFYFNVASFLAEPNKVSLLYFLFYVRSAGSIDALNNGAQEWRITGGSQIVSLSLAEQINAEILLNAPVIAIDDQGDRVVIEYESSTVEARKVVIAMMPKDAGHINFLSGLPDQRVALQDNWGTTGGSKVSMVYNTPFWRDSGLSGTALGNELFYITDNSPEDASTGILMGFPNDGFWSIAAAEREQVVRDELQELFGVQAQDNIDYKETNWDSDPHISGCVSPQGKNFLTSYGPSLRTPVGNIHWAGTETSEIWTGYMDGAVRSGIRVAEEIQALIGTSVVDEKKKLSIYPNPVNSILSIDIPGSEPADILILDINGSQVFSQKDVPTGKFHINTAEFKAGQYSIQLKQGDDLYQARFIHQ